MKTQSQNRQPPKNHAGQGDKEMYSSLDKIATQYAEALQRQCRKMHRLMMAAYKSKIVPLIKKYAKERKWLATNNRQLEDLLQRYTRMIDAEITVAMVAIYALFDDKAIYQILHKFGMAVDEAQRRILLQEILDVAGSVDPAIRAYLRDSEEEREEILEDYESDSMDYMLVLPRDYEERVRTGMLDGLTRGLTATSMMYLLNEYYAMADRKAYFMADNMTYELYNYLCGYTHTGMGNKYFVWLHRSWLSEKPRENHAELDGAVVRWKTGVNDGEGKTFPGERPNCHCLAGYYGG